MNEWLSWPYWALHWPQTHPLPARNLNRKCFHQGHQGALLSLKLGGRVVLSRPLAASGSYAVVASIQNRDSVAAASLSLPQALTQAEGVPRPTPAHTDITSVWSCFLAVTEMENCFHFITTWKLTLMPLISKIKVTTRTSLRSSRKPRFCITVNLVRQ